jgi:hypothetical protein
MLGKETWLVRVVSVAAAWQIWTKTDTIPDVLPRNPRMRLQWFSALQVHLYLGAIDFF